MNPRTIPFLLVTMLALVLPLHAEEQTTSHRIIGLSAPERQDDLKQVLAGLPDLQVVNLDCDRAEVTLKYDVAKLFPSLNPKKPPTSEDVAKRLNDVIGIASVRTFSLKPVSVVPPDKLTKVEIGVGILDCKACRYAAYIAVANVEGVERATVSPATSIVTAWMDAAKTNREALEAALKKARVELKQL